MRNKNSFIWVCASVLVAITYFTYTSNTMVTELVTHVEKVFSIYSSLLAIGLGLFAFYKKDDIKKFFVNHIYETNHYNDLVSPQIINIEQLLSNPTAHKGWLIGAEHALTVLRKHLAGKSYFTDLNLKELEASIALVTNERKNTSPDYASIRLKLVEIKATVQEANYKLKGKEWIK